MKSTTMSIPVTYSPSIFVARDQSKNHVAARKIGNISLIGINFLALRRLQVYTRLLLVGSSEHKGFSQQPPFRRPTARVIPAEAAAHLSASPYGPDSRTKLVPNLKKCARCGRSAILSISSPGVFPMRSWRCSIFQPPVRPSALHVKSPSSSRMPIMRRPEAPWSAARRRQCGRSQRRHCRCRTPTQNRHLFRLLLHGIG